MLRVSKFVAGVIIALAALPAWSQDYYGAIAYSPGTRAHGWASNHPSREAAQKAALSNCRKFAPDCKTLMWFINACGSLASGPGGYGTAWGQTQAAADNEALKLCAKHSAGCSVIRRVCTEGKK